MFLIDIWRWLHCRCFPQPGISHKRATALAGTSSKLPTGLPACRKDRARSVAPLRNAVFAGESHAVIELRHRAEAGRVRWDGAGPEVLRWRLRFCR
ncbi:Protein of unknown function [Gryllus bimaculatus]|nr:Protein of unknown function [Gryllus bimaculatus]